MPIVIKTVGVTTYGGYVLLTSIVGFMFGISSFGINFKTQRFLPSTMDRIERRLLFFPQFNFQLLSVTVFSLVFILLYPIFQQLFFKGEITFSLWLTFPYFLFYFLYSQSTDYFRYTHRMSYFNFATICIDYFHVIIILIIYIAFHNLNIDILFASVITSSILVGLPLIVLIVKEIGFKLVFPNLQNLLKDFKIGFPLTLSYIVDVIIRSCDRYVIAAFITITAVGYYSPAYTLGSLIIFSQKYLVLYCHL